MRIVHFSDIHTTECPATLGACFDKRLFGTLNFFLRRRGAMHWDLVANAVQRIRQLQPDVVCMTGDITSLSQPGEFRRAVDALAPLVEDERFDFLFVPGNHDHYVHDAASEAALAAAFGRLNRNRWTPGDLPVVVRRGPLRFVLLNQALPTPPWSSAGRLTPAAGDWLRTRLPGLAGEGPVVSVAHFPTADAKGRSLGWRRCCRGIAPLAAALDGGQVRVALCGHIHSGYIRRLANGGMECCAGSLTTTGRIDIVDYDPGNDRFRQHWLKIDSGPGAEGTPLPIPVAPEPEPG